MRPLAAEVISIQRLICAGCGAETNATCNCGMEYRPKAARAREAIEATPEKSNRAIAEEIGVDEKTVRKARSTADQPAVQERTGLDGKTRKMPKHRELAESPLPGAMIEMTRSALDSAKLIKGQLKDNSYGADVLVDLWKRAFATFAAWQKVCDRLQELIPEEEPTQSARPVSPADDLSIPDYLKRSQDEAAAPRAKESDGSRNTLEV
jgi:hypothetical protein